MSDSNMNMPRLIGYDPMTGEPVYDKAPVEGNGYGAGIQEAPTETVGMSNGNQYVKTVGQTVAGDVNGTLYGAQAVTPASPYAAVQQPASPYGDPYAYTDSYSGAENTQPLYGSQTAPAAPMQGGLYAPVPEPVQPATKKKGKFPKGLLIAIIAVAALLVIAAGVFAAFKFITPNPEKRLRTGIEKLRSESDSFYGFMNEAVDMTAVKENFDGAPTETELSLNVTLPNLDADYKTVHADMTTRLDKEDKMASASLELSVMNVKLVTADMALKNNRLYLTSPEMFTGTYYVDTDTLGEDLNNSLWGTILSLALPKDLSIDFWNMAENVSVTGLTEDLAEVYKEDYEKLKESIVIEKAEDTYLLQRGDKEQKCTGVTVTIPKEAVNRILEDLQDTLLSSGLYGEMQGGEGFSFIGNLTGLNGKQEELAGKLEEILKVRLAKDAVVNVYFDNKGNIVNAATQGKIKLTDCAVESLEIEICLNGTDLVTSDAVITVKADGADGNSAKAVLKRKAENDAANIKDCYSLTLTDGAGNEETAGLKINVDKKGLDFTVEADDSFTAEGQKQTLAVSVQGSFKNEDNKEFTLELGSAVFEKNGETQLKLAGTVTHRVYDGKISIPDDGKSLTDLNILEVTVLSAEVMGNIRKLLSMM